MNIKVFLLIIIALSLFAPSCSRKKGGDAAVNMEEIVLDDLTPEEKEKILARSSIDLRENKTLADNLSRIEITHDNSGTKIEKQFYNNLPNIKFIAIHTFGNGTKQIIVYGENGSVRTYSDNVMAEFLKSSPDELTREIPVYNNAENQPSSGGMTIKTLPPVTSEPQPVPNSTPMTQIQPAPTVAPVQTPTETKTEIKPPEQPAAKQTPAEAASPQNLRGNLQIYSPQKKKSEK